MNRRVAIVELVVIPFLSPDMSFHVLGRRIIVLNKGSIATEMLDKNSNIYSDRPFPIMAGLLLRREKSIFFMLVIA